LEAVLSLIAYIPVYAFKLLLLLAAADDDDDWWCWCTDVVSPLPSMHYRFTRLFIGICSFLLFYLFIFSCVLLGG